jgi:hypothetical protein
VVHGAQVRLAELDQLTRHGQHGRALLQGGPVGDQGGLGAQDEAVVQEAQPVVAQRLAGGDQVGESRRNRWPGRPLARLRPR